MKMSVHITCKFVHEFITEFQFVSGPREPLYHIKATPDNSPVSSNSTEIFPEDTSFIEESEDESTLMGNKMSPTNNFPAPFKFREFNKKKDDNVSPTSSPIPLPSPDPILIISSDEELEMSMVNLEERISLEMSTDSD